MVQTIISELALPEGEAARRELLDRLPAELRARVDACPVHVVPDLLPWIDLSRPAPERPIITDLRTFMPQNETKRSGTKSFCRVARIIAEAEFFDASDFFRPRLQWLTYRLRRHGYKEGTITNDFLAVLRRFSAWLCSAGKLSADPFDGQVISEWAKGNLPDLDRPQRRAWDFLYDKEDMGAPTWGSNEAILDRWNERDDRKAVDDRHPGALPGGTRSALEAITNPILRAKIVAERRKSCTLISTLRNLARIVLENPPGVNFHRKRPETWDANLPPAGDSLFAFWHQCGANGPQIRKRRNALPGRVWDAINGRNAKARKIQNGAGGSSRISVALARERIASQSKDAKRGLKHPLADCPRTIALRKLAGDGKTMKELLEFAADRSQGGGATLCAIHNNPIAETYLGDILRAGEVRKAKRIGVPLEGPRPVKFFYAKIGEDLTASLESFRERTSHLFGLWCNARYTKLKPSTSARQTPVPTIAKEVFEMSFPERRCLFGEYAGRLQGLSRGDLNRRVHAALREMLEEGQLEALVESIESRPPQTVPADARIHPDGPEVPSWFWQDGQRLKLDIEPLPFALLSFTYKKWRDGHSEIPIEEMAKEVWKDRRTSYGTMKYAVSVVNAAMAKARINTPFLLSKLPRQKYLSLCVEKTSGLGNG